MVTTAEFSAAVASVYARDAVAPVLGRIVADGLGVAAAGAAEAAPALLREAAAGLFGPAPSGLVAQAVGDARTLPLLAAVRATGAAMHVLDFEPMWSPATHAVSPVLPAILGLAVARPDLEIGGAETARALAAGIEAQIRLRRASGQFDPKGLTFHPPGVVGPVGAALATGLLLGLEDEALCHAAGIAGSRSGALLANVGTMTKCLHCGAAAADGLEAALLASHGYRADPDAIAGPRGLLSAFFGEGADAAALTAPAPPAAQDPGPAFKFYPSQYGTHFVIEAALAARANLDGPASAARIHAPPMPYVDRPAPRGGHEGKFSFQYVAACALLDGDVTLGSFTDARRYAADMAALLPRIELLPDPGREGRFDRMVVDVEAWSSRGRSAGCCDGPPGIWGRPVAPRRLDAKLRDCLHVAGAADPAALAHRLETATILDAAGLRALMGDLAGLGPAPNPSPSAARPSPASS